MNQAVRTDHFPRPVLYCAATAVGLTLVAAAYGRLTGPHETLPTNEPALAERDLRFQDRADGAVVVSDARDGATVTVLAPGTNAFVRATVRGLAQQRLREDLGPQVPFRLTAWPDGRLTLQDAATGRVIELEAFGHSNAQIFAGLLGAKGGGP